LKTNDFLPLIEGLKLFGEKNKGLIKVTRLNGVEYWLNPHQIEMMEQNPDTTITLITGKKIVVRETPEQIVDRIVNYRKKLGQAGNET